MSPISFARWVSIVGHPFTFLLILLLLPLWLRGRIDSVRPATVVVVAIFVPFGWFMRRRVAAGKWETVDASRASDRPALYLVIFGLLGPLFLYFFLVEQSTYLVRGFAIIATMIGLGAALNRWIKLSGHLAFAGFAAVVLAKVAPVYGILTVLFLPLLGWSRVALQRHTRWEVLGGLAGGLAIGAVAVQ